MFAHAELAFVQGGNHAQSPCTKTLIVLLGCCDTASGGGCGFLSVFSSESVTFCSTVHWNDNQQVNSYSEIQLKGKFWHVFHIFPLKTSLPPPQFPV